MLDLSSTMGRSITDLHQITRGGPLLTEGFPPLPPTGRRGLRGKRPLFIAEFSFCFCFRPFFVLGQMLVNNVTVEGQVIISRLTNAI